MAVPRTIAKYKMARADPDQVHVLGILHHPGLAMKGFLHRGRYGKKQAEATQACGVAPDPQAVGFEKGQPDHVPSAMIYESGKAGYL
jgi:hypothetical protein